MWMPVLCRNGNAHLVENKLIGRRKRWGNDDKTNMAQGIIVLNKFWDSDKLKGRYGSHGCMMPSKGIW